MKTFDVRFVNIFLIVGMIGISLFFFSELPNQMPIHFDWAGKPDSYAEKSWAAFLLPGIMCLTLFALPFLISISPKKHDMPQTREYLQKALVSVGILFFVIHVSVLLFSMGKSSDLSLGVTVAFAFFLISFGNIMGKVERNFFLGIRTPWALVSDENWRRTHRFAGYTMVLAGFLLVAYSAFDPKMIYSLSVIILSMIVPAVYSYVYYFQNERNRS